MEAYDWMIVQVIIDILIAALLIGFIRFHLKIKKAHNDPESIYRRSEEILSEMRKLSEALNENLEEKRELSRNTLMKLDKGLQRAEITIQHIQNIIGELNMNLSSQPELFKDARRMRSSVNALLTKGLSREEVAQHLGISVGEIELLSKFQNPKRDPGIRK
jgi:transcriptional regulator with XRE-family HTH domain